MIEDVSSEELRGMARKFNTLAAAFPGDKEAREMSARCIEIATLLDAITARGTGAATFTATCRTREHRLTLKCTKCGHVYVDSFDMGPSLRDGDTSAAHAPLDDCPVCGGEGKPEREMKPLTAPSAGTGAIPFLTGDLLRQQLRGSECLRAEASANGETQEAALERLVAIADHAAAHYRSSLSAAPSQRAPTREVVDLLSGIKVAEVADEVYFGASVHPRGFFSAKIAPAYVELAREFERRRIAALAARGPTREETIRECAEAVRNYRRDASFDDSLVGTQEHAANQSNIAAVLMALVDRAAPAAGREEIARIIDPTAFAKLKAADDLRWPRTDIRRNKYKNRIDDAFRKADAILARGGAAPAVPAAARGV